MKEEEEEWWLEKLGSGDYFPLSSRSRCQDRGRLASKGSSLPHTAREIYVSRQRSAIDAADNTERRFVFLSVTKPPRGFELSAFIFPTRSNPFSFSPREILFISHLHRDSKTFFPSLFKSLSSPLFRNEITGWKFVSTRFSTRNPFLTRR